MVITQENINGVARYKIDGKKVSTREFRIRCGMFLSWYGLESMYSRLDEGKSVTLDIESDNTYSDFVESAMQYELDNAKIKIAELEQKLNAAGQSINP